MKKLLFAAATGIVATAFAVSCTRSEASERPVLKWEAINADVDSGPQYYNQKFVLIGDLRGVDRLAFNQFARRMEMADPADTLIEIVPGYYAIGSPRFAAATGQDTIEFNIRTRGSIWSVCYGPDGAHIVLSDGSTLGVDLERAPLTSSPAHYSTAAQDRMPYADAVYERNEQISGHIRKPYDAVPSFKSVELTGGETEVDLGEIEFVDANPENPEAFTVTVTDGKISVSCAPSQRARISARLKAALGDGRQTLPQARISDEPSLPFRGIMIDIARNFQTPAEMRRILDLMASYGLNVLHFHPIDDEAWRLEVPAIPELTEVGGRRGYTPGSDGTFLEQIFCGDGNPDNLTNSSNGYFSRQEYIDMLRYADSLGIRVITEIESPGHARAAIKAMNLRAKRLADPSLLIHEGADVDTSVYTSAQSFHDNVMNPALPGTYRFMDAVTDEIISAYAEAGVRLPAIHIGGDEVPHNAWSGSPAVQKLMADEGLGSEKEVHAYFVKKIASMLAAKGVKTSGWQEIALGHPEDYNDIVVPDVYSVNCWSTLPRPGRGRVVEDVAKAGYPVVLSNVNHFYMDMTYSYHPDERGLSWGGTVDEFGALAGYPAKLCPVEDARLLGVQGQVFSETIRNPENLETMILPKMLGLAERGWNPDSTYSDPEFHAVVLNQMPVWERRGYAYHVRQPGIKMIDGKLYVNTPYPDAVIRLTLDGSMPTEDSPVVQPAQPIDVPAGTSVAKAILWVNGHPSPVSILRL